MTDARETLRATTLLPTTTERIVLPRSGRVIDVPKATPAFASWRGVPIPNTYGRKPVLDVDGEPCFAEIATLRALECVGWEGVWIDSFRRKFWRDSLCESPVTLPPKQAELLARIRFAHEGRRGGTWDVFAWTRERVTFAELKWSGRDRIRSSQRSWLEAGLAIGLRVDDLLVVEWTIPPG